MKIFLPLCTALLLLTVSTTLPVAAGEKQTASLREEMESLFQHLERKLSLQVEDSALATARQERRLTELENELNQLREEREDRRKNVECVENLIFCFLSIISAWLWYRAATLDDSKSGEDDVVEGQHNDVPEFDKKSFYKLFYLPIFLIKNRNNIDSLCKNKENYRKLSKLLNAAASLYLCMAIVMYTIKSCDTGEYSFGAYVSLAAFGAIVVLAVYQWVVETRRK